MSQQIPCPECNGRGGPRLTWKRQYDGTQTCDSYNLKIGKMEACRRWVIWQWLPEVREYGEAASPFANILRDAKAEAQKIVNHLYPCLCCGGDGICFD